MPATLPSDKPRPDAKRVLVLQGGGALGAYQVGAFEALCPSFEPDWVAGISIGAINAALIAGNESRNRLDRLNAFWEEASSQMSVPAPPWASGNAAMAALNEWNAGVIMIAGVPGFFEPRIPPLPFQAADDLTALSIYSTEPLRRTLETLVDFDLLNDPSGMRLSVGAVNVETGSQIYFDNRGDTADKIEAKHIMASAALPPGFPAVKIENSFYWDGGLASNTPLDHVLGNKEPADNLLIFQLDLFSAQGPLPRSLGEIAEREKDIRFASRTAVNARKDRKLYNSGQTVAGEQSSPRDPAASGTVNVMHLIYRSLVPEVASRDYNFSPLAIAAHRLAGEQDIVRATQNDDWMQPSPDGAPMVEYVLTSGDKAPRKRG